MESVSDHDFAAIRWLNLLSLYTQDKSHIFIYPELLLMA